MKSVCKFNNTLQVIIRCLIILVFSVMAGFFLLVLVYLLPTGPMKEKMARDTTELSQEGVYPALGGLFSNTLDNFTDTLMIGAAVYDNDETVVKKVVNAYHPSGYDDPVENLIKYIDEGDNGDKGNYTRYWHGYLVLLKPILFFTDYLMWRSINRVLQLLLTLTVVIVLMKRFSWKCALPVLAAVLFLRPNVIFYSLQYSTMFYVSMISALILGLLYGKKNNNWLIYFYLCVGIITNYFDYLTYPAFGLGLCLVICAMLSQKNKGSDNILATMKYSLFWVLGYGGMWVGKWTIGSILTGENLFADAIQSVIGRSSAEAYGGSISRVSAVVSNLQMASEITTPLIVTAAIAAIVIIIVWQWHSHFEDFILYFINLLLIAAIPFVWFFFMSNHSYIHLYFTYRTLAVTVAALTAAAWRVERKK